MQDLRPIINKWDLKAPKCFFIGKKQQKKKPKQKTKNQKQNKMKKETKQNKIQSINQTIKTQPSNQVTRQLTEWEKEPLPEECMTGDYCLENRKYHKK